MKRVIFSLQVIALLKKRQKRLQELQNELITFTGVTTDTHLRRTVDVYFAWIGTTGQTATLREIKSVKEKIRQLVRPLLSYSLRF